MTDIQPIDSAFTGGRLMLIPQEDFQSATAAAGNAIHAPGLTDSLPVTILIIILTLVCIANLRTFIRTMPSLVACMVRWKENVNLENSVMLSLSRDRVFHILVIPFCILATSRGLYSPEFLAGMEPVYGFLATTGIFLLYLLLRKTLAWIFRSKKMNQKTYSFAARSFRTFFIIIAVVTLATSGIMHAINAPESISRQILLYEIALVYLLFMFRKTQIFNNSCSLISAILYLCALEFLPTGILAATAIVL